MKEASLILVLFFVVAVAAAAAARAQDTSTLLSVELYPTLQACGVYANISGDADGDAVLKVRYFASADGSAAALEGHPLLRLPGGDGTRFAGSLFYLHPGASYDVSVMLEDPDGTVSTTTLTQRTTTRTAQLPAVLSTGRSIWVSAENGADNATGASDDPLRTIGAAAAMAAAGDTVRVRAGIYRETVRPPSQVAFVAESDDAVVACDDASIAQSPQWTHRGDGVYSTPCSVFPSRPHLSVDDQRIYFYDTLSDLLEENGNVAQPGVFPGGFCLNDTELLLYLRLPDRSNPADHVVHFTAFDYGFQLSSVSESVVKGFSVRYCRYGAVVRHSNASLVLDLKHRHNGHGVYVSGQSFDNLIQNNTIFDNGVRTWPWSSCKAHVCEESGITLSGRSGNVARWNTVDGTFNGIYTGSWGSTDEGVARDTDVWQNTLININDDALEPEAACINNRFVENVIQNVLVGVSLSPIDKGPTWVVRNLFFNHSSWAVKICNDAVGHMLLYHNTNRPQNSTGGSLLTSCHDVNIEKLVSRNNIWTSMTSYIVAHRQASWPGPIDFDFDLLFSASDRNRFVIWTNVTYNDLASLQAGTGQEQHGFSFAPQYHDEAAMDLTPVSGSQLVDAATPVPGISQAFAVGTSADIGAFELGGTSPLDPTPEFPPDTVPSNDDSSDDISMGSVHNCFASITFVVALFAL